MRLRSRAMGQKPMVSGACVDCEIAITSIFSRSKSVLLGGGADASASALATGMRFSINA